MIEFQSLYLPIGKSSNHEYYKLSNNHRGHHHGYQYHNSHLLIVLIL